MGQGILILAICLQILGGVNGYRNGNKKKARVEDFGLSGRLCRRTERRG